MEETVFKIDMDKDSLREGLTQLIEYVTKNSPTPDELSNREQIDYNMGVCALFACLRQTF